VTRLSADDVTVRRRVPITTVARTVLDLAGRADYADRRLAQLVNRGRLLRPGLLAELDALLGREHGPGRPRLGGVRLRPYLDDPNGPIRSGFEQEFREALAASCLPPAQFNVTVAGLEVDVLWRQEALVVELDGRSYHSGDDAFEADRERDARLVAARYRVIRITWRRWCDQAGFELDRLSQMLSGRTLAGSGHPAVAAARLGDPAVAAARLGDPAVEAARLGDPAVAAARLGDPAVVAARLGDLAVEAGPRAPGARRAARQTRDPRGYPDT
jgi:very-short-patch-repair endonuclease